MTTAEIRRTFLRFFEERGHHVAASDSLIPSTDPTLLFTSAGMVPFKPHFQNPAASPWPRAASCQKCLRTSDIERVGQTLRHLTFFEMLGNFSFGDYFKPDAVTWAWEFLTGVMRLPQDRLIVSVFKDDEEAFKLWGKIISENRIVRLGEESNFWTMGPTGPCGPCSEILWDRGEQWGKTGDYDSDRYLEIWNLVFTQFDRQADGRLQPLPRKNIDTGMGLERLSLVAQGVDSPFETDAFQALFDALAQVLRRARPPSPIAGAPPTAEQAAFRRIADHARAVTFMISDGILPSNEGRGYVLRRLLRQAVRAGKALGAQGPFFHQLTGHVIDRMRDAYPETVQRRETVASVVRVEEEKFLETLETGTRKLEDLVSDAKRTHRKSLAGADVFQLYDTFGFPIELTREMAAAQGLSVDAEGFAQAQQQAQSLARQGWKGSGAQDVERYRHWRAGLSAPCDFRGYETVEMEASLGDRLYRRTSQGFEEVRELVAGEQGEVIAALTPFYPEGGGQVGDTGHLTAAEAEADVLDTQSPVEGLIVHQVRVQRGRFKAGQRARFSVDPHRREAIMRHHTATHLLHKALREVLGPHVTQAGSLVASDRLRFDFNHHAPLTIDERRRIEDIVNHQILHDIPVHACPMTRDQAHKTGAMMLFGEKYGDQVRAIMVSPKDCSHAHEAWSLELCGGTHVHSTGEVGMFKILSQSSVSAGIRRLEAAAGLMVLEAVRRMEQQLASAADLLKVGPDELLPRLEKMLLQERALQKDLDAARSSALRSRFDEIAASALSIGGVSVIRHRLDGADEKQLREVSDRLRDAASAGVVVLASAAPGKVSFVVSVQKACVERGINAGQIARDFAALLQGSGGGRPDFAQGGGKNPDALDPALAQVEAIVKSKILRA